MVAGIARVSQAHGYFTSPGSAVDRWVRKFFFVVFNLDFLLGGDDPGSVETSAASSHDNL